MPVKVVGTEQPLQRLIPQDALEIERGRASGNTAEMRQTF
jgi:hypothetical protein